MELIRISDRKLKIMLTPTDMHHFDLHPDTFGEDTTGMHRSFRRLLEEVRKQTDFEADEHRISVQYFPSREGGCEMFISRANENANEASPPMQAAASRKPVLRNRFHRECAYRFASLASLLSVCKRLTDIGYIGSNSAFCDDRDRYYLILNILAESPFATPEELHFLGEYGSIENTTLLRVYLGEHGSVICPENAICRLAGLA